MADDSNLSQSHFPGELLPHVSGHFMESMVVGASAGLHNEVFPSDELA